VRKSTSEPNELNHNIWLTIDPCAQSSFAVPDYWKDLPLQSNRQSFDIGLNLVFGVQ
jgi:hypothetical protein